jgi:hypothetical protein
MAGNVRGHVKERSTSMSLATLEREALTALPLRYETRRFAAGGAYGGSVYGGGGFGGGSFNFAAVNQSNMNVQIMEGCVVNCVQSNNQINDVMIVQN